MGTLWAVHLDIPPELKIAWTTKAEITFEYILLKGGISLRFMFIYILVKYLIINNAKYLY